MANINKLSINIQTGTDSGAGTDGDIYSDYAAENFIWIQARTILSADQAAHIFWEQGQI